MRWTDIYCIRLEKEVCVPLWWGCDFWGRVLGGALRGSESVSLCGLEWSDLIAFSFFKRVIEGNFTHSESHRPKRHDLVSSYKCIYLHKDPLNAVNYIDWFSNVRSTLHSWINSIVMSSSFYILLDLICQDFVYNFPFLQCLCRG